MGVTGSGVNIGHRGEVTPVWFPHWYVLIVTYLRPSSRGPLPWELCQPIISPLCPANLARRVVSLRYGLSEYYQIRQQLLDDIWTTCFHIMGAAPMPWTVWEPDGAFLRAELEWTLRSFLQLISPSSILLESTWHEVVNGAFKMEHLRRSFCPV